MSYNYEIKLGLKNSVGGRDNTEEHKLSGTISNVMTWITERLSELDKTIHDIFHLEIYEKD